MFLKRESPHVLTVGMTGVKLGDRLLYVGCAHGARMAAIAAKVGLSGQVVVIAPDAASAHEAQKSAANAGVLVDVEVAPPTQLPVEAATFDLAVVDDTGGLFGASGRDDRSAGIREVLRALRSGGRAMIIGPAPPSGLSTFLSRAKPGAAFVASGEAAGALAAEGFKSARTLAAREGLVFVEGIKPR